MLNWRTASSASARSYSSIPTSGPSIFISRSTDPYLNLSLEDWLFRKSDPNHVLLFLYRNTPSVIIGRNQNPWKEINLARLKELDIPFVRRRSGGGTVYHDLGNTNYCILVPRTTFDRKTNATLVAHAVRSLGIPAYVNERNDICVEDAKIRIYPSFSMRWTYSVCGQYVSGSAFKLSSGRAYHHGTMLIEAKLNNLRGVLRNTKSGITTKGVASVSSPVKNLEDWSSTVDHDGFVDAVVQQFADKYKNGRRDIKVLDDTELETNEVVQKGYEELRSWEWKYGQTPEFTHDLQRTLPGMDISIQITSKHGLITRFEYETSSKEARRALRQIESAMIGDRYGTIDNVKSACSEDDTLNSIVEWLEAEM